MSMMLTITGADDTTDPDELVDLSMFCPFVEWAILVGSNEGTPRFPTAKWIDKFLATIDRRKAEVNLSLHLCGRHLREFVARRSSLPGMIDITRFRRIQLNWHGQKTEATSDDVFAAVDDISRRFGNAGGWCPEVIFQLDGVNNGLAECAAIQRHMPRIATVSGLFDCSHGAGVLPEGWPVAIRDIKCGWAGGLGPENLEEQLPKIVDQVRHNEFWVDMETRVRTADDASLDMRAVRRCLVIGKQFIEAMIAEGTSATVDKVALERAIERLDLFQARVIQTSDLVGKSREQLLEAQLVGAIRDIGHCRAILNAVVSDARNPTDLYRLPWGNLQHAR